MGLQLLTVKHRGKSGTEAKVGVGVGPAVVGVAVEDASVGPVAIVPAAVRHPLVSYSRILIC